MDNRKKFLLYLFITGIGDGLFFIGVGKLLSFHLNMLLGASLLFIINEISKLGFQFIFSTFDRKFSMKKAIIFSEMFQSLFLILIIFLSFDIFSNTTLILSLIVLNFFEGLSKIAEFHLTMSIFEAKERKKYNSYISTINQSSKILGFILGGLILVTQKYELLFILNSISFLFSGIVAISLQVEDSYIIVQNSWKSLVNKNNYHILVYTFIIASNTIILSSNSILGFDLSSKNIDKTIIFQISNALGSSLSIFLIKYSLKFKGKENKLILTGIFIQGILFLLFNYLNDIAKIAIFISISTISFFNLSLYITKLQDYAEKKFGSKVYSLRQLNRAIFNLFGVTLLTTLSIKLNINYQSILGVFCFFIVLINIILIRLKIINYSVH